MSWSSILRSLRPLLRPLRASFVALLLTVLWDASFDTAVPVGVSVLVDRGLVARDGAVALAVVAALLAGFALSAVSQLTRDRLYARCAAGLGGALRDRLEEATHLSRWEDASATSPSEFSARFGADVAAAEGFVLNQLPTLAFSILYLVLGLAATSAGDWRLALLSALTLPLAAIVPLWKGKGAERAGEKTRLKETELLARAQESLRAQGAFRVFRVGSAFRASFRRYASALERRDDRFLHAANLVRRSPDLVMQGLRLLLLAYGAWLAWNGELGVGALVAFNLLYSNIVGAVQELSVTIAPMVQAKIAFSRLLPWLAPESLADAAPRSAAAPRRPRSASRRHEARVGLGVEVRDARLRWPSGAIALDGVAFVAPPGSRCAIVGPSGSGKSTLVSVLCGLRAPDSGLLLAGGRELPRFGADLPDGALAAVFQENPFLDASVRRNVVFGRSGLDDAAVWRALELADLARWVRALPGGLDTRVGENGAFLSGGQRQRLALARAFALGPSLLVLDEATSSLDPIAEARVLETLRGLGAAVTVLQVTHRLESARESDRIVVLDRGRVAEEGDHESLLAARGLYASMWRKQEAFKSVEEGLATLPLFARARAATRETLAASFRRLDARAGDTLIRKGCPGSAFYVVVRGMVDVWLDADGAGRPVASLSEGDICGEMALLSNKPTSALVRCRTDCEVLELDKASFLGVLERDAELAAGIADVARAREEANRAATGG